MTGFFKKASSLSIITVFFLVPLFAFQNCSNQNPVEFTSTKSLELPSSIPKCSPTQSQACQENNGLGIQFCDVDGNPLKCQIESCVAGYTLIGGACVALKCSPQAVAACTERNGSGQKTCNAQGTEFGACVLNACDAGFNLQGANCVANLCEPKSNMACSSNNGMGNRVCNDQGTGYGDCVLSSCNAGYNLQAGKCVANACMPNSTTTCAEGNGSGTKTCNSTGTGYGACQLNACNNGFNLQNGVCVAQACVPKSKMACQERMGTGEKVCNDLGTAYGACQLTACDPGHSLKNGTCIAYACTPNSAVACTEGKGTGIKTCNAEGSGFGACVINACSADTDLVNGVCVRSCLSQVAGEGTVENPYQIKNTADLFCVNRANTKNWVLMTNLSIGPNDYPVFEGQALRKPNDFLLIKNFYGALDGNYHQINYRVNCAEEPNNCLKLASNVNFEKRDIALFGTLWNSKVQRLRINYDFSNIQSEPAREYIQYAAGLALDCRECQVYQVSTRGKMGEGPQVMAGLFVLNGYTLENGRAQVEQCDAQLTVEGSFQTNGAALIFQGAAAQIKNSTAYFKNSVNFYNRPCGFICHGQSDELYRSNTVTNSFLNLDYDGQSYCGPRDFMGIGPTITASPSIVNSFWTSNAACNKRDQYPQQILPLDPSLYSTSVTDHGFDQTIWAADNRGLPVLRWLQLLK